MIIPLPGRKMSALLLTSILGLNACGGGGNNGGGNGTADTTPPVITLSGESEISINVGATYVDQGATANDNIDGNVAIVTDNSVNTELVGQYTVTYSATDASGNNAVATRTVNVVEGEDITPPVITLVGENSINVVLGDNYLDPGAAAADNVDGVVDVLVSNEVNTAALGQYSVSYQALDSAGNRANAIRTVNVVAPDRVANSSCVPPSPSIGEPGEVGIDAAYPNLPVLDSPLAMVQPASDSSFWLVALRAGRVVRFANDENVSDFTTVLDMSDRVVTDLELGFTGLAFHPNYPSDNRVFVVYNDRSESGQSTVSSFNINTTTQVFDTDSETVLLTVDQDADNHNGGDIAFGPDGMLYVAFGDGGYDWQESQRLYNLLGTMIRIDVSGDAYTVPTDNPFNTGQARCETGERVPDDETTCPEIFAYGLRNPWRWSFDRETGDIWVADVGEDRFEEVNRIEAGGNYGWPIMEADACFNSSSCDMSGLSLPVTQYPRSVGVSTVGGYVYRGTSSPSLIGQYIWGDTFSSEFLSVPATSSTGADYTRRFNSSRLIAGMAEGNDGEIYLLNLNGGEGDGVYRVVASGGSSGSVEMPGNLSDVGCFNTQEKVSETGVVDYSINSVLWSDSALKQRAFAIPDGEQINVLSDGDFDFPTNTILIKHFLNGETYLETRLFVNHSTGWAGYSYEWNDQQTDAILLNEGKTENVGDFVHIYPSSSECNICHTSAANGSLGVEVLQLNRIKEDSTANQLDFLSAAGYFSDLVSGAEESRLYSLDDESATLEQRARSYLHSNCSGCHRPGAASDFMDLRYSASLPDTNTCNVNATLGDMGVRGAQRIAPGNADASVILLRMQTLDGDRMPPVASLQEDQQATQLIRDWVNGLNGCN